MAEEHTGQETDAGGPWLTLQEASAQVGVSPSTLRRWAAAGRIPTRRTAGGHRRFDAAAIAALAPRPTVRVAWEVSPQALAHQPWHAQFVQGAHPEQMRALGQRLLGLLIQYLAWQGDDSRFLADAQAVGETYGQAAGAAGASLSDTVQAFLYFRATFGRLALQVPPATQATDVHEMARLADRIGHFMDAVLLSTVRGYEQPGPGARIGPAGREG